MQYQPMLRNIIGTSLLLLLVGGCEQPVELTDGARQWRLDLIDIQNIDSQENEANISLYFKPVDHSTLLSDALNYSLDTNEQKESLERIYLVDSTGEKYTAQEAGLLVGPLKAPGRRDIIGERFSFRVPVGSHGFTFHIFDLAPVELGK